MSAVMWSGLQLMGYGLLGVFATLVLFMLMIKLLMKCFPQRDEE